MTTTPADDYTLIPLSGRGVGLAPHIHPANAYFWESIARGALSLQRCGDCRTLRFPLSPRCHNCLSALFDWEVVDTRGVIDVVVENPSATVGMPRIGLEHPWNEVAPYFTGNVDMDCGVRMPGRIICDCGGVRKPRARVRGVLLETTSDIPVYGFGHECVLGAAVEVAGT
ncbi:zinc ribbon domain-containing protein [Nocardia sp. NPDC019395]|uniref:Zn-ribbon domain-containing OB-fold protein n=1 Tax=Nocardia sp. NPDC019395 TaxID=3154686 RepID=UPI0034065D2A